MEIPVCVLNPQEGNYTAKQTPRNCGNQTTREEIALLDFSYCKWVTTLLFWPGPKTKQNKSLSKVIKREVQRKLTLPSVSSPPNSAIFKIIRCEH